MTTTQRGSQIISAWPNESREAAELVIQAYGEPQEATDTELIWHHPGQWKRIVATREFYNHSFPAPHNDSVESFIDYRVPPGKFTALAEFDGSVIAERTAGEISARCHDEQANFLALNLAHEIVSGERSVEDARSYYAEEFLNARRKQPTPYMEKLRFSPADGNAADPDERTLSDEQLQQAVEQGKQQG